MFLGQPLFSRRPWGNSKKRQPKMKAHHFPSRAPKESLKRNLPGKLPMESEPKARTWRSRSQVELAIELCQLKHNSELQIKTFPKPLQEITELQLQPEVEKRGTYSPLQFQNSVQSSTVPWSSQSSPWLQSSKLSGSPGLLYSPIF